MNDDRPAITVLYDDIETTSGEKSMFRSAASRTPKVGPLDATALQENLTELTAQLSDVLQNVDTPERAFGLGQFEITVELTAKGELRLIGSVGAEVKGGLKLIFSRSAGS